MTKEGACIDAISGSSIRIKNKKRSLHPRRLRLDTNAIQVYTKPRHKNYINSHCTHENVNAPLTLPAAQIDSNLIKVLFKGTHYSTHSSITIQNRNSGQVVERSAYARKDPSWRRGGINV